MARIAEARPPAEPVSKDQVERRARIIEAAAELGARAEFDHVQMNEVAKDAGVAIATLYRYFPSKTHLFAAVWEARVDDFTEHEWPRDGTDPVAEAGDGLVALSRMLLAQPRLCTAMVRSSAMSYVLDRTDEAQLAEFAIYRVLLRTLGDPTPDEQVRRVMRLLVYSWWGVLVSSLSEKITAEQAEADLRTAARLLLGPYAR